MVQFTTSVNCTNILYSNFHTKWLSQILNAYSLFLYFWNCQKTVPKMIAKLTTGIFSRAWPRGFFHSDNNSCSSKEDSRALDKIINQQFAKKSSPQRRHNQNNGQRSWLECKGKQICQKGSLNWSQFHQHSTSNFCSRRSQKRKKLTI